MGCSASVATKPKRNHRPIGQDNGPLPYPTAPQQIPHSASVPQHISQSMNHEAPPPPYQSLSVAPNYPPPAPNYPTQAPNYPTQVPNYPTQVPNYPQNYPVGIPYPTGAGNYPTQYNHGVPSNQVVIMQNRGGYDDHMDRALIGGMAMGMMYGGMMRHGSWSSFSSGFSF